MVQKGKGMKKKGKGKAKVVKAIVAPVAKPVEQVKPQPFPASKHPKEKEGNFHFCHTPGHWFRNCKLFLEDLKKKNDYHYRDSPEVESRKKEKSSSA
ncbi:hypothetical protein Syun_011546 [Stephania yunnanensis]|uniref:Uncharacterized protein n=1 Tax=Stephania yunnanensis TaxID=152371 RepID=A0AAP0JXR9_9MAGN